MDTANPPKGDYQKAEKYINQLVTLLDQNKIEVVHTDLQKFDPTSLQDHYRVDLKDYQIEISHSKLPNSGADSFVMLFTNLKNIQSGTTEKAILAYTQLSEDQFHRFKTAAVAQIDERHRQAEEKRFTTALEPIDTLLTEVTNSDSTSPNLTKPETTDSEPSFSSLNQKTDDDSFMPFDTTSSEQESKKDDSFSATVDSNPYF